jgi:hypothetical protein
MENSGCESNPIIENENEPQPRHQYTYASIYIANSKFAPGADVLFGIDYQSAFLTRDNLSKKKIVGLRLPLDIVQNAIRKVIFTILGHVITIWKSEDAIVDPDTTTATFMIDVDTLTDNQKNLTVYDNDEENTNIYASKVIVEVKDSQDDGFNNSQGITELDIKFETIFDHHRMAPVTNTFQRKR